MEDQRLSPMCVHTHSVRVIENLPGEGISEYFEGKEILKGNQQLDWMAWIGWRKDETKKLWYEDIMWEVLTSY